MDSSAARLHGGMIPFNPAGYYLCRAGEIHCGCVVVAWQLCDCNPGDGRRGRACRQVPISV
jgi:hypothetical protein